MRLRNNSKTANFFGDIAFSGNRTAQSVAPGENMGKVLPLYLITQTTWKYVLYMKINLFFARKSILGVSDSEIEY